MFQNFIDIQSNLLGVMLKQPFLVKRIVTKLSPDCFSGRHKTLYKLILDKYNKGEAVSPVLIDYDKRFITKLIKNCDSSFIDEQMTMLEDFRVKQEYVGVANKIIQTADKKDINSSKILADITNMLNNIKKPVVDVIGSERLFRNAIESLSDKKRGVGVKTDIPDIDKITHGWQKSDLVIIAGRSGMGKSSFIKNCINGCVAENKSVALFSLEMTANQIMMRIIGEKLGIPSNAVDVDRITDIHKIIPDFFNENKDELLFIDDTPSLHINDFRSKAMELKHEKGIDLIVIDYIQLMRGDKDNRVEEIDQISMGLKRLAKELDIPIIAFAQLNRAVEQRSDKIPQLSDLRESGSLEMNADIVCFLFRPYYYFQQGNASFEYVEMNGERIPSKGISKLIIAKHRNGALGNVYMTFTETLTRFSPYERITSTEEEPFTDYKSRAANEIPF